MQSESAPDVPRPDRCPRCSARVHGDVPWCMACHAPFAATAPVRAADTADHVPPAPAPEAAAHAAAGSDVGTVPGAAAGSDVAAVADRLLAELAAARTAPAWGGRLPAGKAGRTAVLVALVAIGSVVLLGLMTVVGLAL